MVFQLPKGKALALRNRLLGSRVKPWSLGGSKGGDRKPPLARCGRAAHGVQGAALVGAGTELAFHWRWTAPIEQLGSLRIPYPPPVATRPTAGG